MRSKLYNAAFGANAVTSAGIVIFLVCGLNACSDALEGASSVPSSKAHVDITAPTWSVTPDSNGLLAPAEAITIVFSESMDTTSLTLLNDLVNEASQPTWSTTAHANDTLTLSPNTNWSDGLRRSIHIEASDMAGNNAAPIILLYDIDSKPPRVTADPFYTISNTPLTVTLTCDDGQGTGCKAIYYTSDGTIPKTDSLLYTSPVRIDRTTKFKYIAEDNAGVVSNYVSGWYTIDLIPPTGAVAPAPNQIIGSHDDIEVQFSEEMDTISLKLSGTMAAEVGVIEWTTVNTPNDHLILHPFNGSNWSLGVGATLTIAARDPAGNALENALGTSDISLTYDIGTIHVSIDDVNALETNPGTRTLPVASIQSAITKASALAGPSKVLVAQGDYSASNLVFTEINMAEQVSLFGGYAPDWSIRDPIAYKSTITAGQLTVDPSFVSISGLSCVVCVSGAITWRTIIDGFTIDGGSGKNPLGPTSAVYIAGNAGPIIKNNVINGGDIDGEAYSVYMDNAIPILESNVINGASNTSGNYVTTISQAIYATNNANPLIKKNNINGGNAVTNAAGISFNNASADIKNNDINAGDAATAFGIISMNSTMDIYNNVIANIDSQQNSYGISVDGSSVSNIYNNTIDPGTSNTSATGIVLQGGPSLVMKNNIITNGICIQEADIDSDPLALEYNDLFNCLVPYYDADAGCINDLDGDGVANTCNVDELNSLSTAYINNFTVDPVFQNPANFDYHFSATSPTIATTGGVDLSAIFSEDKDGAPRTLPWSIGAYEQDP